MDHEKTNVNCHQKMTNYIYLFMIRGSISSKFSSNFEAFEILEEIFPRYYMQVDMVQQREMVKLFHKL